MTALVITQHAVQRYQERVANVDEQAARAALSSQAIRLAASFGAPFVKLGTGQHVVIMEGTVITVLPSETWTFTLSSERASKFPSQPRTARKSL